MKLKRLSSQIRYKENKQKRNSISNRYKEKELKQLVRTSTKHREKENEAKRIKKNITETCALVKTFYETIQKGPTYICTCCDQLWYRESVQKASGIHIKDTNFKKMVLTGKTSYQDLEWICHTCVSYAKKLKIPPLAKSNLVSFPQKLECLNLTNLEERLIAPRIPFMQLRELPRGGQISINGNVVNVPTNINSTVYKLPRTQSDDMCIPLQLKRKLSYSHHVDMEMVRPNKIKQALRHLISTSALYQEEGITFNESWTSEPHLQKDGTSTNNTESYSSDENETKAADKWDETTIEDQSVGILDTMMQPIDMALDASKIIAFAPAEGNSPVNIFLDKFAEELSFPTIFCGEKRHDNKDRKVPVYYSELCKSELRRSDRRVSSNIPNLFFKVKKIQAQHISDKANLCIRKTKSTSNITAGFMKKKENVDKICHLDEGYKVFKDLRGSPPYWEKTKKDLFAMIRCLGIPTWFASFSSAETRWVHLLQILAETLDGNSMSQDEINNMNWFDKCNLIRRDPVTCARHFQHQVNKLISNVLLSSINPVGKIVDYFYKVEFQMRGSPHIHMLIWVDDSPVLEDTCENELDVLQFVDKYVTCSKDSQLEHLIRMQEHAHSRTCRKKGKEICRFGYPLPPLPQTLILKSLDESNPDKDKHRKNWNKVFKYLNALKSKDKLDFDTFLQNIELGYEDYILALRSSISSNKIFLKRTVDECRVNSYNKTLLLCWRANIDLQFVLDPYACAMYIVTYIAKSQRGMSNLLYEATKAAREGNMDLRKQVKSIGQQFLTHVEISAQEAVYYILQMPLKMSSRDVIFINTAPPEERSGLLKSMKVIEALPDDSTDIQTTTVHQRYASRPNALHNLCLADFVSNYRIYYSTVKMKTDVIEDSDQECMTFKVDNVTYKKRTKHACIRYVRYQEPIDQENFFREILLLFHPWTKESDIIGKSDTFTEQYRILSKEHDIKLKMDEYNHTFPLLDQAILDAENTDEVALDEKWNEYAPSACKDNLESQHMAKVSDVYVEFAPPQLQASSVDFETPEFASCATINMYMKDEDYFNLIRTLNVQQQHFFMHILHHFKSTDRPLYQFLSGGAGVGKSVLVKAIYQTLTRFFNSKPGANPDDPKVLLAAPTGKAAHLIKGNTLHSLLKIPANQGFHYKPLTQEKLNTLQCTFRHVHLLIIDEISMVGNKMFSFIHQRLQQIMGSNKLFGGISILAVGDMFQLKPVFDGWIFETLSHDYGPLALNLWKDHFKMYELQVIMRQKECKQFAEVLNRLRESKHTQADITLLLQRKISTEMMKPEYPLKVPHIYLRNADVDSHNQLVCDLQGSKCIKISALDVVLGDVAQEVKDSILRSISNDTSKTMGLAKQLNVAFGLRYELSCNVQVVDGMTNGAAFTIKYVGPCDQKGNFAYLWAHFENDDTGKQSRKENRNLYTKSVNKCWTPVHTVKRQFPVGRYKSACVIRKQFPIRCAAAKTAHRCQGDTMQSAVVDFTGRTFPHSHYVAISRVTDLNQLYIRNLNETKITVDSRVQTEQERLRKEMITDYLQSEIHQVDCKTILFHNVRSLHKHIRDIQVSFMYDFPDCMIFAETKLKATDDDELFKMANYHLHRFDWPVNRNRRPSYGIAVYTKKYIQCSCFTYRTINSGNDIIEMVQFHLEGVSANIPIIRVTGIYVSPKTKKKTVMTFLSNISPDNTGQPHIYIGDFNHDLNKVPKDNYIETMLNCTQLVTSSTTDSQTLIDHIYASGTVPVLNCFVMDTYFSDHKPIVLQLASKMEYPLKQQ